MTKQKERRKEREKVRLLKQLNDYRGQASRNPNGWHSKRLPFLYRELELKGYVEVPTTFLVDF